MLPFAISFISRQDPETVKLCMIFYWLLFWYWIVLNIFTNRFAAGFFCFFIIWGYFILHTFRLSLKYKCIFSEHKSWMNEHLRKWTLYKMYISDTFEHILWAPCNSSLLFSPLSKLYFSVCFSFHLMFFFSKLIPHLFMLFPSNSTEIPLPSSPSKQLTHTISEPKDTSKLLYHVYFVIFYCKFSISLRVFYTHKRSTALQEFTCIAKCLIFHSA